MRHDPKQVDEKIRQAARSYLDSRLGQLMDAVERRIMLLLADEGKPTLAVEVLGLQFLDLSARLDDLERPKQLRDATLEEYAKMAREWKQSFPDSQPPSIWQLPTDQR